MLAQLLKINGFAVLMAALALSMSFVIIKGFHFRKDLPLPASFEIIEKLVRYGLPMLMIGGFTILSFPVLQDDFMLLRKGVSLDSCLMKEGEVTRIKPAILGLWFIYQNVYLEDDETSYTLYFSSELIRIREIYRIYYLPHSRSIVKIERL